MALQETISSFYECLPLLVFFLCVKNANKSEINFITILLGKKLSKSIVKIAPDIDKYLRSVFPIQTIQDIAKFYQLLRN